MSHTKWSGTSSPRSMIDLACLPSSVFAVTFARRMSPVEICGILATSTIFFAWVPFPAPGAPRRTTGPTRFGSTLAMDVALAPIVHPRPPPLAAGQIYDLGLTRALKQVHMSQPACAQAKTNARSADREYAHYEA